MIWDANVSESTEPLSSFRPRHEMKFLIPESLASPIRDYVSSFCKPDPMGVGNPSRYKVTTLQLDSADLTLHRAKSLEQLNRFKLRVRSYGESKDFAPVFVEIKRKLNQIVCKSRAKLDPRSYAAELKSSVEGESLAECATWKDRDVCAEFVRLSKGIGAVPVMRVRYDRECWIGDLDTSVRITLDQNLEYQPATDYMVFNDTDFWRSVPIGNGAGGRPKMVLELKSGLEVPCWMLELVRHFGLRRTGYCKYSEAVYLESKFSGLDTLAQSGFRSNQF